MSLIFKKKIQIILLQNVDFLSPWYDVFSIKSSPCSNVKSFANIFFAEKYWKKLNRF